MGPDQRTNYTGPWRVKMGILTSSYEVGHNTPYVGVIDAGAKAAVMIEIRRDVVGAPSGDPKWQRIIAALSTMPIGV
jgi:predicted N-formylglutamate amidohydrolase